LSGVTSWHTGENFSLGEGDQADLGNTFDTERPNYAPNAPGCNNNPYANQSVSQWINLNCFTASTYGTVGNNGRNNLLAPGYAETDIGLTKNTRINERLTLQFRAEIFNIFNHPNFSVPGIFGTGPTIINAGTSCGPTTTYGSAAATASGAPLVRVVNLSKEFAAGSTGIIGGKKLSIKAVAGVNLEIQPGETLGLVGESGSGKSTLGRLILKLLEPTEGAVYFDGRDLSTLGRAELRTLRQQMQLVFQDPYASLNPRMRVRSIVGEGIEIHNLARGSEKERRIAELLAMVGMSADAMDRLPHEFSGGQRQRIGIARALAVNPRFLVLDEPVSALDVSIQAQIINLLQDLQEKLKLTYLFIAHDLRVVEHISNRVAIMYLGKIVEIASRDEIYLNPRHPYTRALLSAIPTIDTTNKPERIKLPGEMPSPMNPPSGCAFHPRCPYAKDVCTNVEPKLESGRGGHAVACHVFPAP